MFRTARKYWYFVSLHWQEAFTYRAEMFLWTLIDVFPLMAMLILWLSVYRHGDSLGGFSLAAIISYYVVGSIFNRIIEAHVEEEIMRQINTGEIAKFFLRPLKVKLYWITAELGWKIMSFMITLVPLVVLIWLTKPEWLQFNSWFQLWVLVAFGALGFGIEICLSLLISAFAFFFDQGRTLSHAKWVITGLFNGSLLPLALYPDEVERWVRRLPFHLLFATPMELYLGIKPAAEFWPNLLLGGVWLVIMTGLVAFVWRKAEKQFTSVGG